MLDHQPFRTNLNPISLEIGHGKEGSLAVEQTCRYVVGHNDGVEVIP
jgi:hypothetical protein